VRWTLCQIAKIQAYSECYGGLGKHDDGNARAELDGLMKTIAVVEPEELSVRLEPAAVAVERAGEAARASICRMRQAC